jgi:hypothetical protein
LCTEERRLRTLGELTALRSSIIPLRFFTARLIYHVHTCTYYVVLCISSHGHAKVELVTSLFEHSNGILIL